MNRYRQRANQLREVEIEKDKLQTSVVRIRAAIKVLDGLAEEESR